MAISPVKPGALDPKSAQFYVAIQNVGDQDVVLNLGNMLANGKVHRPDALHLLLTDAQGRIRELEFSDKRYAGVAGRMDDFIVALRSGATYILRLNLEQYWSPGTKEFGLRLTPGRHTIAARFEGKGAKSGSTGMKDLALMNFWKGSLESNGSNFEVWLQAGLVERVARLVLVVVAGACAYFGVLWLLGFRPRDFSRRENLPAPAPPADAEA